MSTLILLSNKNNIINYKNNINNGDGDRDNGGNNGSDNNDINKSYNTKITHIQDKPSALPNHESITPYTSLGLRPSEQLVPTHTLNLYKN